MYSYALMSVPRTTRGSPKGVNRPHLTPNLTSDLTLIWRGTDLDTGQPRAETTETILSQSWFDFGPSSTTLAQHKTSIG